MLLIFQILNETSAGICGIITCRLQIVCNTRWISDDEDIKGLPEENAGGIMDGLKNHYKENQ
ncbi:hypothetical protein [Methanobrevibacter sp.]|uniref:hypothetical protein n=1 Tax=Methanobrevibacter sp. TaxID=66852 RepID=UPI00388E6C6B